MALDDGITLAEPRARRTPETVRPASQPKPPAREQLAQMPDDALTPEQLAKRLKWRGQRERYVEKHRERYIRLKREAYQRLRHRRITGEPAPRVATPEESAAMRAARRARYKAKDPQRWLELRAAEKRRAADRRRAARFALLPVLQPEP